MTLEILQKEMIAAMKAREKFRKEVISGLVSAVKKAGIDNKCRENIPEELVNQTLLKEKKTMQEMIDTCPASRPELAQEYADKMEIINQFAPSLLESPEEVESYILSLGIEISKKNRGSIMKALKGKADMKVANEVLKKYL